MKKIVFVMMTFVFATAMFAKNHHSGIDVSAATGFGYFNGRDADASAAKSESKFFQPEFKISTYDCFALFHMLGIYASFGVGGNVQFSQEYADIITSDDISGGVALDFAIGPAFGIDLGSMRFNVGAGFHINFTNVLIEGKDIDETFDIENFTLENTYTYCWFGLAVAPQIRFFANRRCSFIIGCDLAFDFGCAGKLEVKTNDSKTTIRTVDFEDAFRFGCAPYIGLGINFGS